MKPELRLNNATVDVPLDCVPSEYHSKDYGTLLSLDGWTTLKKDIENKYGLKVRKIIIPLSGSGYSAEFLTYGSFEVNKIWLHCSSGRYQPEQVYDSNLEFGKKLPTFTLDDLEQELKQVLDNK